MHLPENDRGKYQQHGKLYNMQIVNRLIFGLFFCLFFTCGCDNSGPRIFYISSEGDDSNTGSLVRPWKTISRLNRETLRPGDRIFLEGGTHFSGTLLIDSADITGGDKIIISSFGKGRAVIDGGTSSGIRIKMAKDFIVRNLTVKGSGRKTGNETDGMVISHCSDFILDSIEVTGFQHSGIKIRDCTNTRITNVSAHGNGFAGIHVTSEKANHPTDYGNENIYIGYCTAFNNPGDPTVTNNHSGNGILASSVKGGIIEYCEAYNNGWDMPWTGNGPVGIWIWDCTDFTIQYCISHHNKTNPVAKDGGGFDLDGGVSNSVIQYCISYNNQGAGYGLFEFGASKPWQNNIVRYNISLNDGLINEGSLAVWKGGKDMIMSHCEIYNNTFINDTLKAVSLSLINNCEGFRFTNNIFLYGGTFIMRGQKIEDEKFISNCMWNTKGHINLPDKIDKENLITDPLVNRPFTIGIRSQEEIQHWFGAFLSLQPGSPLIDRGASIEPSYGIPFSGFDIAGTPVPQGKSPDIGAVEFIKK